MIRLVANIGNNHKRNLRHAESLVRSAKVAGANVVCVPGISGMAFFPELWEIIHNNGLEFWVADVGHNSNLSMYHSGVNESVDLMVVLKMSGEALTNGKEFGIFTQQRCWWLDLVAVPFGISVIQKNFDDEKRSGPDGSFSLSPSEFKRLALAVRDVEKALGK